MANSCLLHIWSGLHYNKYELFLTNIFNQLKIIIMKKSISFITTILMCLSMLTILGAKFAQGQYEKKNTENISNSQQSQEPKKYLGNNTIKTKSIWPIRELYALLRPKIKTLDPKETLVVNGVLVQEDGSHLQGMTIRLFPVNDIGTAGIVFYGTDEVTSVVQCLNPESKSDSKGYFSIRTGPLWKIANFLVIGIYAEKSGLAETTIRSSVNDELKNIISSLDEKETDYKSFAIIPVMEGEFIMKIPIGVAHNKINLGKIVIGSIDLKN